MPNTSSSSTSLERQVFAVKRAAILTVAIVAIVVGVIALFWPRATLSSIGFLFGIYLVVSGIQRIARAILDRKGPWALFLLNLIAGILITVAGVLSLTNVSRSLVLLALIVGLGWVIGGVIDIVLAARGHTGRWLVVVGGLLSVAAGLTLIFLPGLAAGLFLKVGAILLIVVGVGVLLTFPRRLVIDQPRNGKARTPRS